jgi:integrase/recombinase XerD
MSLLAPTLEAFFTDRLTAQRQASPHTICAYRDTWRLLLRFACSQSGKTPSALDLADIDARVVGRFLDHLERERQNTIRTRNARLAAIHSLFRYAALRHPEHAEVIQRVLAIPHKRFDRALVDFLIREEIEALLAAPDKNTWVGRRDHALLLVAIQTGLRVSELTGLLSSDLHLGPAAHLFCRGKNRKQRSVPLTAQTVAVLKTWLRERHGEPDDVLFPTIRAQPGHRAVAAHQTHRYRRATIPLAPREADYAACPQAYLRDDPAICRGGRLRDRTLARTRRHRDHRHLPHCRPAAQGTGTGKNNPAPHRSATLSRQRQPAHLPRQAVIMPSGCHVAAENSVPAKASRGPPTRCSA